MRKNIIINGNEVEFYQADKFGNIYTIEGHLMTQFTTWNGYNRVKLSRGVDRKMYLVHRVIAETFINNPEGLPIVNHKDDNRLNNEVNNLEWCNNSHNQKQRFKNRIGTKAIEVKQIDLKTGEVVAVYSSPIYAEQATGIARQNISKVAKGQRNHAGGFGWSY